MQHDIFVESASAESNEAEGAGESTVRKLLRNGLVSLTELPPFPGEDRLSPFAQVAVRADLACGKKPHFQNGMTLEDAVIITGLPREEAARRIRRMQAASDPKGFAEANLAVSSNSGREGQSIESPPIEVEIMGINLEDQKTAEIIPFPIQKLPFDSRPVSNPLVRSALFAAIKGKDRQLLNDYRIATIEGWEIIFSGEQFNQDDKDTLMQLVFMARETPFGHYVTVPAHNILRALGRDVGGKAHQTLKEEIERLVKGTIKLIGPGVEYIGHIIDDAIQDKTSKHWVYRLNPKFASLFSENQYTLVDWERRKNLKRKDLARWLQLELATHAAPFPRSVEFYKIKSGSRVARLCDFRKAMIIALDTIKENGDITGWEIDAADIVYISRKMRDKQPTD